MTDANPKSTPLTHKELRDLLTFARMKARECVSRLTSNALSV